MSSTRTDKGVILAAGWGSRLQPSFDAPKPLVQVGGIPILFRSIQTLARGGVERICVVLGHRGLEIRAATEAYARQHGLGVEFAYNQRWREPNGLSVVAARDFTAGDDFILSMSDHLLDVEIVRILQRTRDDGGAHLAVDEKIDSVLDLDDATKVVCVEDHRIVAIGKQLRRYNAVDCGVFCCTDAVHEALLESFESGGFSLSDGMQLLADRGRFHGAPIGACHWQDVDTLEMQQAAESLVADLR